MPGFGKVNTNSQGRFAHIDALRCVAVMLVVVNHAGLGWVPGTMGVTIFFTISGFIITTIVLKERSATGRFAVGRFYFNRAAKLMPPFLLLIAIPTFIWAVFHPVHWGAFAAQVFFAFNWVEIAAPAVADMTLPGSGVVWSLGVEEQFYIGFALIWLMLAKQHWARSALIALCIVTIAYSTILRSFLEPDTARFVRATDARLDSIAWGVLAAVLLALFQEGRLRGLVVLAKDWVPFAALALVGASGLLPFNFEFLVFTMQSIATAMFLVYGLMPSPSGFRGLVYRVSSWGPVSVVGLASYSIYLSHYQVILLVELVGLPSIVSLIASLTLGTLVGVAVWQWVEKPVLEWKKRAVAGKRAVRVAS